MVTTINLPVSAVADANGTAVTQLIVRQAQSSSVWLTAQVSGPIPSWQLLVDGQVQASGQGANINIGPVFVPPGSTLKINVSGCTPGATMSGSVAGAAGDTPQELQQAAPSATGAFYETPQRVIGTFTAAAGTNQFYGPFTLPSGTQSVAIAYLGSAANISVSGFTTGVSWGVWSNPGQAGQILIAPVLYALDTQVQVIVNATTTVTAYVAALTAVEAVALAGSQKVAAVPGTPGLPTYNSNSLAQTSTGTQTLITIPKNRTWYGSVYISTDGSGFSTAVQTAGATVLPLAGVSLAYVGNGGGNLCVPGVYVAAGADAGNASLTITVAGTGRGIAGVIGVNL